MMRIIYAQKILELRDVFPMDKDTRDGVWILVHFFLTLYAVPWFTADFATEAAFQDLQFFQRLHRYKRFLLSNCCLDSTIISPFFHYSESL